MAAQIPKSSIKGSKVLVFDSGAGGLSITKALLELSSEALSLNYLADNHAFPYGNKTREFLVDRIQVLMAEYIARLQPDLVVIACNTASTLVLPVLRSRFHCPFVGTVPAIKPAAKLSQSKHLGVLATPATVAREYTNELIQTFAPDVNVILYGSDRLVQCAEAFINGAPVDPELVKEEVERLLSSPGGSHIDTVVLACTHFPLIADEIKRSAPHISHWVDSGHAVARRCLDLLNIRATTLTDNTVNHDIQLFFTAEELMQTSDSYLGYLSARAPAS